MAELSYPTTEACQEVIDKLRTQNLRWAIFKITDDKKSIDVVETSTDPDFEILRNKLLAAVVMKDGKPVTKMGSDQPTPDCRYAVYNFVEKNKSVFIRWCPDNSSVAVKMNYSGAGNNFRRPMSGWTTNIQATDDDEISLESVTSKLPKSYV